MRARKLKEEIEIFHAYLRQNGLKKTYQKDVILEAFLGSEGHMSVEDVYSLVRRKDRKVGIVTVFRTLKSLTACGMAREIDLGDGLTRFEHSYHHPHHHHIICTECNKTIEFVSPDLERIKNDIVDRYHFQPVHHRFQVYGVCEDCRLSRPALNDRKHDSESVFARDALRMAILMEKRGIEFYRDAADRNRDAAGREVFATIAGEESKHLAALESELGEVLRRERGLEQAPMFLLFDPGDLEELVPDLRQHETGGELRLDARRSMEIALQFEQRAAAFFREYAGRFVETLGRRIFLRFADEEMEHYQSMSRRMDQVANVQ